MRKKQGLVVLLMLVCLVALALQAYAGRHRFASRFSYGMNSNQVLSVTRIRVMRATGRQSISPSHSMTPRFRTFGASGGPNFGADCAHDAAGMYGASEAIEEFRAGDYSSDGSSR